MEDSRLVTIEDRGPTGSPVLLSAKDIQEPDLTQAQELAIDMLAFGTKPSAVADQLGVLPHTLNAWRTDPKFLDKLSQAQEEARDEVRGALLRASTKATSVLVQTLEADDPNLRLKAAESVLDRTTGKATVQKTEAELAISAPAVIEVNVGEVKVLNNLVPPELTEEVKVLDVTHTTTVEDEGGTNISDS